jgi:hypothetical protein
MEQSTAAPSRACCGCHFELAGLKVPEEETCSQPCHFHQGHVALRLHHPLKDANAVHNVLPQKPVCPGEKVRSRFVCIEPPLQYVAPLLFVLVISTQRKLNDSICQGYG